MTTEPSVVSEPTPTPASQTSLAGSRSRFARGGFIALVGAMAIGLCVQAWYVHDLRREVSQLQNPGALAQALPAKSDTDQGLAPLATWDPFDEMQRMQARMDQRFDQLLARQRQALKTTPATAPLSAPQIAVNEEPNEFVIKAQIPGARVGNVNVQLSGQRLTIEGNRQLQTQDVDKTGGAVREERSVDSFARTLTLPKPVASTGMTTDFDDGVLTVRVPKLSRG